jgi:hypothetical protein
MKKPTKKPQTEPPQPKLPPKLPPNYKPLTEKEQRELDEMLRKFKESHGTTIE